MAGAKVRYTTGVNETPATIAAALAQAAERLRATSPTPRLDAELLLAHVLGWGRARLLAEGRASLHAAQQNAFAALIERRAALEPVAYLVGHREFYGLDFLVDARVLVPRPETELLVDLALRFARRPILRQSQGRQAGDRPHSGVTPENISSAVGGRSSVTIADIGTGSGCIAIALAANLPGAQLVAVDRSPGALEVARTNAERHGVAGQIALREGDLLAPLVERVDILVSNPPYTILREIDEGVRRYEPHAALDGGADGLNLYRRLLAGAPDVLRPGGAVLLEIGATQGPAVAGLARQHFPQAQISVHKDLAGLDRVVAVETQPPTL